MLPLDANTVLMVDVWLWLEKEERAYDLWLLAECLAPLKGAESWLIVQP